MPEAERCATLNKHGTRCRRDSIGYAQVFLNPEMYTGDATSWVEVPFCRPCMERTDAKRLDTIENPARPKRKKGKPVTIRDDE